MIATAAGTAARDNISITTIGITAAIHPDPENEGPTDEIMNPNAVMTMGTDTSGHAIRLATAITEAIPTSVNTDTRARRNGAGGGNSPGGTWSLEARFMDGSTFRSRRGLR